MHAFCSTYRTYKSILKLQLCIVLNNMQHVREELSHLEERLEFESFYKWLDSEDESTLGAQCRAMVTKLLSSSDDDIYNRMSKIMTEITDKVGVILTLSYFLQWL